MEDTIFIKDKSYSVIDCDEYITNKAMYTESSTAILHRGYVYPLKKKIDDYGIGYCILTSAFFHFYPIDDMSEQSEEHIIRFKNPESYMAVVDSQSRFKDCERKLLASIDNIYVPIIDDKDYPEMVGLKEAIGKKKIEINKYGYRFGENFNNDKRLLDKNSISIDKLKLMCNNFDIKATLILEDKAYDVPNPMGENERIVIELTGGAE